MKNNALILLWKGEAIPDYLVEKIAEILISNGVSIPEMLKIKYKDEDGIANALLNAVHTEVTVTPEEPTEAVKNAIIYIGKRFEYSLTGTNGNLGLFALELSNAYTAERKFISLIGTGRELVNAVKILATTNITIPKTFANKHHITNNVIEVIKKVYNSQN